MVWTSSVTLPGMVGLRLHAPLGAKSYVFCLSITFLNGRAYANEFAIKVFENGTVFMPLNGGRFVVVHLSLAFSLRH